MARYFTKSDREAVISLLAVEGRLQQIIEEWATHDRPKEWLTELKKSRSFLIRANESIKGQCEDEEFLKVAKLYKGCSLTLIPKAEYKSYAESATVAHIPLEAWGNLAETYIETNCKHCMIGDTPNHTSCTARSTMMMAGVPSLDDPVPEGRCQYFWFEQQAAAAASPPEHWATGIKMKNGIKHYRCRVFCKNTECRVKTNRYIPEGTKRVRCSTCGVHHEVRMALSEGFPKTDEWGNFYIADRLVAK